MVPEASLDMDLTVRVVITGRSPLVMHHPRTADADDETGLTAAIKEITDKGRDMTGEDRKRKEALQWRACLYTEMIKEAGDDEPRERLIVPIEWLRAALEEGGKTLGSGAKSKGAAVLRSVTPTETFMLLGGYNGPADVEALGEDPSFRWRTLINPNPAAGRGKRKAISVRPKFRSWEISTTLNVVTYMGLSWEDFEKAFRAAGNIGIGDARKQGMGRFRARLTKLH